MKECNICKRVKSLTEFHKNVNGIFGVRESCKVCLNVKRRLKYREDPKLRERQSAARKKACAENPERVKESNKRRYTKEREARLEEAKRYYEENKEERKAYARSRREKSRLVAREYRKVNKERLFQVNLLWRQNNKHRLTANQSKRNAIKARAIPCWAEDEWDSFVVEEVYHLSSLRSKMLNVPHNVDHIVPLNSKSVCGLHCAANLQILARFDNISKGNRYWPDMWVDDKQQVAV